MGGFGGVVPKIQITVFKAYLSIRFSSPKSMGWEDPRD